MRFKPRNTAFASPQFRNPELSHTTPRSTPEIAHGGNDAGEDWNADHGRFWGLLRSHLKHSTRTPGTLSILLARQHDYARKIRAAQFAYWFGRRNMWEVTGNMLETLFWAFWPLRCRATFLSCVARHRRHRTQRETDRMFEERVCGIFCGNSNVVTEHSIKH